MKVIISSGVGQEDFINEVVEIGAKGAVNKPYGMRQLLSIWFVRYWMRIEQEAIFLATISLKMPRLLIRPLDIIGIGT